jgi:phosphatidylserine/phosphatidylglycerophosphate/cardiolipin synthase-like enzyme
VDSGSYPVRSGNLIRPLVDGEPAFRRICEAIEGAGQNVWAAITFMWPSFEMPDRRGHPLQVFERAAARGLDVRLVFYRPHGAAEDLKTNAFWGSSAHVAMLERWAPGVSIRWDQAAPGYAQHQKCWLIDAGEAGEVAFVGGINLNPHSMVAPGHSGEGHNHDIYLELAGPSAVDVHHNLVQRWNDASERDAPGGAWGRAASSALPFPTAVPASRGESVVQIQRTLAPDRHGACPATPGGAAFDARAGERSIRDQYRAAIGAARQSIYIENQFVEVQVIVDDLRAALERGVEVAVVLPGEPDPDFVKFNRRPERAAFLTARDDLGAYDNFTLVGLAGLAEDGRRAGVYVHSKLMLVDDAWGTIGSANLHHHSLSGNAEINASFADAEVVRSLRCELLGEHLGEDASGPDSRAALRRLRAVAQANRGRKDAGDPAWQGLAFALDVETYGRAPALESAASG